MRANVAERIERLGAVRILVVGDVMLDRFVRGNVTRISPEAPIPIVRVVSEDVMLGGAGNVARNAAALGATAVLVGLVGDDAAGTEVAVLAEQAERVEAHLITAKQRRTTVKTRYVAGAQQLLRADIEDLWQISADDAAAVRQAAVDAMAGVGAVVLSDYAKGALGNTLAMAVIAKARESGIPVLVDPKGTDYRHYRGVTAITPNAAELSAATGLPVTTSDEAEVAAAGILAITHADAVIVTRGKDGMSIVERDTATHLPVRVREVFDVSGAGDTVVATLAVVLAAGGSLRDAAELANAAASVVVQKVGTAVARPGEVVAALYARERLAADEKISTLAGAVERVQRWRRSGDTVAFTNGCFDLLHPGHVSLLRQARATAARLVVGLNSDASVRRLKGRDRPVQNEAARATVLASLADVDLVVLFAEDTPIRLIESVRPDVLVKGADYTIDQVVGADIVRAAGGRVVLANLVPGESSSRLVNKAGGGTT